MGCVVLLKLPWLLLTLHCCLALKPYIVYMGASSNGGLDEHQPLSHLQLLSSVSPSEKEGEEIKKCLRHSYNHAFKGFSALLTEAQASILSGYDEVVSIFPDPRIQLHTTRSWDFLELADLEKFKSRVPRGKKSTDVIIGVIDTGIWPESESFKDDGVGKIPSKWRGICMEGFDFNTSHCNRKLIGARFYTERSESSGTSQQDSPRDTVGHGTHTASTAGGALVANANYYGLAKGVARGGFPSARIASYKACSNQGCDGSSILKAFDDAIKDGVDIISISIGMPSSSQHDFLNDPIAIGAFHAEQRGVLVVGSAGNDGPTPYTIVNTAPWIFTVAASTIDRDFQSTIVLGNDVSYEGLAIHFFTSALQKRYPLILGEKAVARSASTYNASNCNTGSLDPKKAAGNIVVCESNDPSISRLRKKLSVENAKAVGMILISSGKRSVPIDSGTYPVSEIEPNIGSRILRYINSTKNPTAKILPTKEIRKFKPAPIAASFSSKGPGIFTENILKPDVTAPGVSILAAVAPIARPNYTAPGNKPSLFRLQSGTSMACPHVSGAAAYVKSAHPEWSSSMIKSALVTSASYSNNVGSPFITNTSNEVANPHEIGAGEIRPIKALDPGLTFETTTKDHLNFLCHYGYKRKTIRSLMTDNKKFKCPKHSKKEDISDINYPTISIGSLNQQNGPMKVRRVAMNVGYPNATYTSHVSAPPGLIVKVVPKRIVFKEGLRRASFKVVFDGEWARKGYNFGDIRWLDGVHLVRVVFAVNVV